MFTIAKPSQSDKIAAEMVRLYLMFWMPRVTVHLATGAVTLEGGWLNEGAEDLYHQLESLLALEKGEGLNDEG